MGAEHAIRAADLPALPGPSRWLFAGSIALSFAALGVMNLAYAAARDDQWRRLQALSWAGTAVAALAVGAFATHLPAAGIVGLCALASVAQVAVDLGRRSHIRQHRQHRDAAPTGAASATARPRHRSTEA